MKFAVTIVIALLLFALLIRLSENKLIYYPMKVYDWSPKSFDLQLEDCFFETRDGEKLHGWLYKDDDPVATILWCHGNAGNISHRLDNLAKLAELPVNVFIFDYRGYGKSSGSPDEAGVYRDAEAAYDYLVNRDDIDPNRIVIFGRSLGGAVAVDLATKRNCAALILESTFTSAKDMARNAFAGLPFDFVIKTKFDSIRKISRLHMPILFLHGTSDDIVPLKLGRELFHAANEPKEFYEIPGAGHNDTYMVGGADYFRKLGDFISRSLL